MIAPSYGKVMGSHHFVKSDLGRLPPVVAFTNYVACRARPLAFRLSGTLVIKSEFSRNLCQGKLYLWGTKMKPQLRQRFVEAVAAIDRQMLQRVWQELD
jgi:hypothetical protein